MLRQAFGATPGAALFSSRAREIEAQGTAACGGIGNYRAGCEEQPLERKPPAAVPPQEAGHFLWKIRRSNPVGPCRQPNGAGQFWQRLSRGTDLHCEKRSARRQPNGSIADTVLGLPSVLGNSQHPLLRNLWQYA